MKLSHKLLAVTGWLALALLLLTRVSAQSGGGGAYLRIWDDSGNPRDYQCVEVPQDATPTPEGQTVTPAPQPTATPLPTTTPTMPATATLTPLPLCSGVVSVDGLNVRSSPRGAIVNTFAAGTAVGIERGVWYNNGGTWELWYKLLTSQPMYVYASLIKLNAGSQCSIPPEPAASITTVIGIRTVPGAIGFEAMYPILKAKEIPYGVSPYASLSYCVSALQQGGMCVYRPGAPDCPPNAGQGDPRASAREFMGHAAGAAYILKGAKNVWIEATNECTQTPLPMALMVWWRDFYMEYIDQAAAQGWPPLALPGFSPGNGDITLFETWEPMFVSLKAHGGLMSTHAYTFISQTGLCAYDPWEAARHTLQHKYMLQAGYEIPIIITEAARRSGEAPVDIDDMVCFIEKVRQEGYIAAVFLWVGGWHPSWSAANLDGYYEEIARRLQ